MELSYIRKVKDCYLTIADGWIYFNVEKCFFITELVSSCIKFTDRICVVYSVKSNISNIFCCPETRLMQLMG